MMKTTNMVTFEKFKEDMNWTMMGLSDEQLKQIYDGVVQDEYATFEDIDESYELTDNENKIYFEDVELSAVVENLKDYETSILMQILTNHWGFNGLSATIYYLSESNTYCLVFFE